MQHREIVNAVEGGGILRCLQVEDHVALNTQLTQHPGWHQRVPISVDVQLSVRRDCQITNNTEGRSDRIKANDAARPRQKITHNLTCTGQQSAAKFDHWRCQSTERLASEQTFRRNRYRENTSRQLDMFERERKHKPCGRTPTANREIHARLGQTAHPDQLQRQIAVESQRATGCNIGAARPDNFAIEADRRVTADDEVIPKPNRVEELRLVECDETREQACVG